VKPLAEAASGLATRASRLTLASLRLPKRWAAWTLALAVLVRSSRSRRDASSTAWRDASKSTGVMGDRFWTRGPMLLCAPAPSRRAARPATPRPFST